MNTFKMQCINYLLVNGWVQDVDGYEWAYLQENHSYRVYTDTMEAALWYQFGWEDEGG